jgi:3-oxoacyl-[acyl-carrier-protein] synthase-3
MTNLISSAIALPRNGVSTNDLINNLENKLSPDLIKTIQNMGVRYRYSTLDNYPEFLCGDEPNLTCTSTDLSVDAAKRCINHWGGDPRQIGLLIAATNTPARLLPGLASEVTARMNNLSRSISTVNMQAQGCSVLMKSIEVASWYLCANPYKYALILMAEAHTPLIRPLIENEYFGYREIAKMRKQMDEEELEAHRLNTTFAIQATLFGDGAVALLVGNKEEGRACFGPVAHWINDEPEDVELLTMDWENNEAGMEGKSQYVMRPNVPQRGAHYAAQTVKQLLANPHSPVACIDDVKDCMIHTGSKKILDGVCERLELQPYSDKVRTSYEVLHHYGNLSSVSTGFMLAAKGHNKGTGLVVSFGVGFAASAGVVSFN